MGRINVGRLVLGTIVAAIVLFLISGLVNGAILGDDWKNWQQSLGSLNHAAPQSTAMLIWAIVALVYGLAGVWIYAGIRPRYGAGPKTAIIAGFILWLAGSLTTALVHFALDDIPQKMAVINCIAYFVGDPLAVLAAASVYKE